MNEPHAVIASSFADLADVQAFQRCKLDGHSDAHCFRYGDNGVGCWGDFTATEKTAMCALPPEDWLERWGSKEAARGKRVLVIYQATAVIGELRDTMPHKRAITNGCGIDLNPGFAVRLGLTPPFKVPVVWAWAEEEEEPRGVLASIKRFFGGQAKYGRMAEPEQQPGDAFCGGVVNEECMKG